MYMLCIYYTYTDYCFVRDMTQPQVSKLCSWSSNISACLDRQPIWRGSILLLSTCGRYNRSDEDILLNLFFFSPFEELCLRTAGIMESKGIHRVYEPSPVPTLYIGRVEDLLGRVPLIPCFLDENATSTISHKYSSRQWDAFECCCADGAGPTTRRGSHVYEINTWLWKFGRPQPRVGGLSVAKTEKIRRMSRSDAAKRAWATVTMRARTVK
jgi:hypothetical protein